MFKKIIALTLAAMTAVTVMATPVSAADSDYPTPYITLSEEEKSASIDKIVKMTKYGKELTSKTITTQEEYISAYQYAQAQGAKCINLVTTTNSKYFKQRSYANIYISRNGNSGYVKNAKGALACRGDGLVPMFVYAYRYGKTEVLKDTPYTCKHVKNLYKQCVNIIESCGVNDKSLTDAEIAQNIATAVHDYINGRKDKDINTKTDKEKGTMYQNWCKKNGIDSRSSGALYPALMFRHSACSGFAKSYMLLMRMAGYKCWEVNGELEGTGHVWNAIRVDGELRFVDVGWIYANSKNSDNFYHTYDEMKKLGYKFKLTEKELEMCCKY